MQVSGSQVGTNEEVQGEGEEAVQRVKISRSIQSDASKRIAIQFSSLQFEVANEATSLQTLVTFRFGGDIRGSANRSNETLQETCLLRS